MPKIFEKFAKKFEKFAKKFDRSKQGTPSDGSREGPPSDKPGPSSSAPPVESLPVIADRETRPYSIVPVPTQPQPTVTVPSQPVAQPQRAVRPVSSPVATPTPANANHQLPQPLFSGAQVSNMSAATRSTTPNSNPVNSPPAGISNYGPRGGNETIAVHSTTPVFNRLYTMNETAEFLKEQGNRLVQEGQIEQGIRHYTMALRHAPSNPILLSN